MTTPSPLQLARDRAAKGEACPLEFMLDREGHFDLDLDTRIHGTYFVPRRYRYPPYAVFVPRDSGLSIRVMIRRNGWESVAYADSILHAQHLIVLLLIGELRQLVAVLDPAAVEREGRVKRLCEIVNRMPFDGRDEHRTDGINESKELIQLARDLAAEEGR